MHIVTGMAVSEGTSDYLQVKKDWRLGHNCIVLCYWEVVNPAGCGGTAEWYL